MQPGVREQKLGAAVPIPGPDGSDTIRGDHSHRVPVGEPGPGDGGDGAGQGDNGNGGEVLPLLAAGPGDEHAAAAAAGVPEVAEGDEAANVLLPGGGGAARAAERGDGGGDGDGGGGGGDGVGGDEPEHDGADGGVRVRVRERRRVDMEGGDGRGVRWAGATDETGSAELYRDMLGVVVVRDRHGPCWVLA